jgi:hypothetical protein
MDKPGISKEIRAAVGAVAALIVGIVVVAILRRQVGATDGLTIIALFLVPLVVYGLMSDKLLELTAGTFGVKFKNAASNPLQTSELLASETLHIGPGEVMPKLDLSQMWQKISESVPYGGPNALTMKLRGDYYGEEGVASVIEELSQLPNFRFIVVLDEEDKLLAYAPLWAFGSLSKNDKPDPGFLSLPDLVDNINHHKKEAIKNPMQMRTDTVSIHSSNKEALEKMENVNLEAIAVVDEKEQFRGVVERNRIVSQMMAALAKDVKGKGSS